MEDLRYIRKRFRCHNCYTKFSKLVPFSEDRASCKVVIKIGDKCGNISFTVSEEDFMRQTRSNLDKEYSMVFENKKKKEEEKKSANNRSNNHQQSNQRQQPTNSTNNNSRVNFNERARSFQRNQMPNNNNNNRSNQNSYNNFYYGDQFNRGGNRFPNNMNNPNFNDFLGFVGNNFMNNNNNNNRRNNSNSHYSGVDNNFENIFIRFNEPRIITHEFQEDIFDPIFMLFGSNFNNIFRNNFSSNFRSSFVNDDFVNIIEERLRQNQNSNKPPASKEAIDKLKKFKMSEKYCKKNDKGVLEQPTCCICICEIKKNEETLLLPCGHMFHSNCIMNWLNQNNTCPVCRFELTSR